METDPETNQQKGDNEDTEPKHMDLTPTAAEDDSPADSSNPPETKDNTGEKEKPKEEAKAKPKEKKPKKEKSPKKPEEPQKYVKKEETPRNEKLYLLEFVVDRVNLDFFMTQKLKCYVGEICVVYRFLNYGPFNICEKDFMPTVKHYAEGCTGRGNIKNGNSCLFPLNENDIKAALESFFITAEVFKNLSPGNKADKLLIGRSVIRIESLFNQLMELVSQEKNEGLYSKTYKNCFKLFNTSNELVGHLNAYVRLSCLGKIITNNFQMNSEDESVEVKANKGHYLFKYNKKQVPQVTPSAINDLEIGNQNGIQQHLTGCTKNYNSEVPTTSNSAPCEKSSARCIPPNWDPNNIHIPKCTHRLTPCCTLRCDFLPKTCPFMQRHMETQTLN